MKNMTITAKALAEILNIKVFRAVNWVDSFNATLEEFAINTPLRLAHFLAQVGHESGRLQYTAELASGAAYERRSDLGNLFPGDGVKFKGRGLIQITGRLNYVACGKSLKLDLLRNPELLISITNAVRSAGWFWKIKNLNELADEDDLLKITKRVNGGYNGLEDRRVILNLAKAVLEC